MFQIIIYENIYMVKNSLQKGLEKYIKSTLIESFHGDERKDDEQLDGSLNEDLWVEDGINDENTELTKRNWPFFIGILVFYIIFFVLINFVIKSD